MKTSETQPLGAVLSALAKVDEGALVKVILELARDGNLEALSSFEMLPDIEPESSKKLEFGLAVMPLINAVDEEHTVQAKELVSKWVQRNVIWDPSAICQEIRRHIRPESIDMLQPLMNHFGARLEAENLLREMTRSIVRSYPVNPLAAFIHTASYAGLDGPLEEAIIYLGGANADNRPVSLLGNLDDLQKPTAPGFGRRAVSAVVENSAFIEGADEVVQRATVNYWCRVLDYVQMEPEDWTTLALNWKDRQEVWNSFSDRPNYARHVPNLISAMANIGIGPDEIKIALPGRRDPAPMIFRAAQSDNLPVVKALLDAGADAEQTIKFKGKERTPAEVAGPDTATAHFLLARRAQMKMSAVRFRVNQPK